MLDTYLNWNPEINSFVSSRWPWAQHASAEVAEGAAILRPRPGMC